MEIKVTCENRRAEVFLKGELDHHGAKGLMVQIEREIERQLPLQLILDFTGISFMDSSGIAVVIRSKQRMKELGGTVKLRKVPAQPKRVFEAAGIGRTQTRGGWPSSGANRLPAAIFREVKEWITLYLPPL